MSSFAVRLALMSETKTDGCGHTLPNLVPLFARVWRVLTAKTETRRGPSTRSARQHTVANRRPALCANSSETTDQVG